MVINENTRWIIGIILASLGGLAVYAADWQRTQDDKISDLDKLIEKQKLILEHQIQINELNQQQQAAPRAIPHPQQFQPYQIPQQTQHQWRY